MKFFYLFLITAATILQINGNSNFGDKDMLSKYHHRKPVKKYSLRFKGVKDVEEKVVINMLPHSHDDVGWLKTVEEYFDGLDESTQKACVRDIITSVIGVLGNDPNKKFIIQEMAFFTKWWATQNEHVKSIVRDLLKDGQLEFVGGGYTQNDEATLYYEEIIDQVTLGHRFLKETFNYIPKTAWQIDAFGHSSSHAALLAQMGFDSVFFARVHFEDKKKRLDNKEMEFIWSPSLSSGEKVSLLAHINYYHYEAPPGFCFDPVCHETVQIVDEPDSEYTNIKPKSDELVDYFKSMSLNYKHKSMIHTFGSDFQYTNAFHNFQNMDKLINFISADKAYNVDIHYTLPRQYINDLNLIKSQLSTEKNDFFPYADSDKVYWTGYFTTRPTLKGLIRASSRFLQASRTFVTLLYTKAKEIQKLDLKKLKAGLKPIEEALAISTHHDASTGTAKEKVSQSYAKSLNTAFEKFTNVSKF